MRKLKWLGMLAAALTAAPISASADTDLTTLSLDDLMASEVTSVAKRPQRVDEAPAAVFVISQDDIRRSGADNIPDILRMAPGIEVARLPSGGAAVTARGFNGRFSNKLLVLIDGRAIYLSTLGGVLWDQQLFPVEDIQRIEIVRGPGATMWGANAVNGVINIVTKHAVDTLGLSATAQQGSTGDQRLFARAGFALGDSATVRLYATGRADEGDVIDGFSQGHNESRGSQAGFRADWEPSALDAFTLQGNIQSGKFRTNSLATLTPLTADGDYSGGNILGRWTRSWNVDSRTTVQAYWDRVERRESGLDGVRDLADLDINHYFRIADRHAVVVGVGYRHSSDEVLAQGIEFIPTAREENWFGAFIEDEFALIPDRLMVSVGVKLGQHDITGSEFQPSVRAIWNDPTGWSAWAAVSRAERTASRLETSIASDTPIAVILPAPGLSNESMVALEAGWRGQIGGKAVLDLAVFHHRYEDLITWSTSFGPGPFGFRPYFQELNQGKAENTGVEAALELRLHPRWTTKVAASWQDLNIDTREPQLITIGNAVDQGASPRTQLSVRSMWDVRDNLDLDVWVRHVSKLETGPAPAYTDVTARLAWRPTGAWEIAAIGSSLADERRVEIIEQGFATPAAVVERRVSISLSYRR